MPASNADLVGVEFNSANLLCRVLRRTGVCCATLVLPALLALDGFVRASEPQAVLHALSIEQRPASTEPVRLPPIDSFLSEPAVGIEPFALAPIASFDLFETKRTSALSLGVGMPGDAKPSVGGWISFGYSNRGFGQ